MVTVLSHDYFSRDSAAWLSCLSVAGEDGTLLERFRGTDLRGRLIAKTGFVNGVSCLSGYLHARDNAWYCFSIMFNGIPEGSNSGAKVLQERIVRAVDQHENSLASRNELAFLQRWTSTSSIHPSCAFFSASSSECTHSRASSSVLAGGANSLYSLS